jgi:hypothetical protein
MAEKELGYQSLRVHKVAFDLYVESLNMMLKMNRALRHELGRDIIDSTFDVLKLIREAYFASDAASGRARADVLVQALRRSDDAGIRAMAGVELGAIDFKAMGRFTNKLTDLNKQLANWKRASEKKATGL